MLTPRALRQAHVGQAILPAYALSSASSRLKGGCCEGVAFQLRVEALNLANRSTFAPPVTDPFSTNFGKMTNGGTIAKRFIQIAARITF